MTAEEFLTRFTDQTVTRYDLSRQCVRKGWRYATDAAILCCIKTGEPDFEPVREDGRPSRFPDVYSVVRQHESVFADPSQFVPLHRTPCASCNDTGTISFKCDRCGGSGICCCRCGDEHDCTYCDGSGNDEDDCRECQLTIKPGVYIAAKYVRKIADIPGVVISHHPEKRCSPFLFQFDGMAGQGVVCHRLDDHK